ncbi:MAG: tetraacyldisaccharide 4'-kinase [Magnetococcales bacterium]|nr:tetraacyldisaccharide 4'-kinase [Magnetococcales bacterium]
MAWFDDLVSLLDGSRRSMTRREWLLLHLLRPWGWSYGSVQALRAHAYARRWLDAFRAPVPVISVGNLTSGGTGKTPMVLWLAREILAMGYCPVIVSRGYGQRSRAPVTVVADPDGVRTLPPLAADEASLLARRLPGTVVLTGPERRLLMQFALRNYPCDVILMDDGFQHLQVVRDLDLVLLDAARPWGNGHPLPAGILREFPEALRRCDGLILTRADCAQAPERLQQELATLFPDKPSALAHHKPGRWTLAGTERAFPLEELRPLLLQPFCGLARPDTFRLTLDRLGMTTLPLKSFSDHHLFRAGELAHLVRSAVREGAQALVCTEKDAVKIDPAWTTPLPLYFLAMEIDFPADPLWLRERVRGLLCGEERPVGADQGLAADLPA